MPYVGGNLFIGESPLQQAPNRVLFGPHVTNLGRGRALSDRHVAYYERRAAGGCGVIVTEEASVHDSDWPYERAPLAADCEPGWRAVSDAVHRHGALSVAALGHAGGQGSSAYHQRALWAPSRVPEVNSREVPKWMEASDIDAVVGGFATAAALAVRAGCDGVEVNAGQHSLLRQFLSGLTNHRDDEWGQDRLHFARTFEERDRIFALFAPLTLLLLPFVWLILVGAGYVTAVGLELVGMALGGFGPDDLLQVVAQPAAAGVLLQVQLSTLSALCLGGIDNQAAADREAQPPWAARKVFVRANAAEVHSALSWGSDHAFYASPSSYSAL